MMMKFRVSFYRKSFRNYCIYVLYFCIYKLFQPDSVSASEELMFDQVVKWLRKNTADKIFLTRMNIKDKYWRTEGNPCSRHGALWFVNWVFKKMIKRVQIMRYCCKQNIRHCVSSKKKDRNCQPIDDKVE